MEPTNQSTMFKTFNSINKQLEVLRTKLQPVIKQLPSTLKSEMGGNTEVQKKLFEIESNLSDLIDIIEL